MATYYDTLGVAPTADAATVRAAYLALARRHHPDRHAGAPPAVQDAAATAMRSVNEAWAVLSDPARRRDYDRTLGPGPAPPRAMARPARAPEAVPEPEPAHGVHPLRYVPTVLIVVVLFAIFVFTAYAGGGGDERPTTTFGPRDLAAGACVRTGRVIEEVPCDGRHDATVVSMVAFGQRCPANTAVYTLDTRRNACLRPAP